MTDQEIIKAMKAATSACPLGPGWLDRYMSAAFAVAAPMLTFKLRTELSEAERRLLNTHDSEWALRHAVTEVLGDLS